MRYWVYISAGIYYLPELSQHSLSISMVWYFVEFVNQYFRFLYNILKWIFVYFYHIFADVYVLSEAALGIFRYFAVFICKTYCFL